MSKYGVFSGPFIPVFGLNTETYGVNFRIQSEDRKIRTRKTPCLDTFHAVFLRKEMPTLTNLKGWNLSKFKNKIVKTLSNLRADEWVKLHQKNVLLVQVCFSFWKSSEQMLLWKVYVSLFNLGKPMRRISRATYCS